MSFCEHAGRAPASSAHNFVVARRLRVHAVLLVLSAPSIGVYGAGRCLILQAQAVANTKKWALSLAPAPPLHAARPRDRAIVVALVSGCEWGSESLRGGSKSLLVQEMGGRFVSKLLRRTRLASCETSSGAEESQSRAIHAGAVAAPLLSLPMQSRSRRLIGSRTSLVCLCVLSL